MGHFVYLLECRDHSYYCGYTADLGKRVKAHNEGRGAKYTTGRRPVKLVYCEKFGGRGEALKREARIKSLSREKKRKLFSVAQGNIQRHAYRNPQP